MAVILCHLLLTLLLSGQGLCQCYSQSSCAGDVVPSSEQRDCCVNQFGLSYNDTETCRPCLGFIMIDLMCIAGNKVIVVLQFMDSL